jgi:hypothetical protein
VTRAPDFRDLVGNDLSAEERERLRRIHDLIVAAGPPPELPDSLAEAPSPGAKVTFLQRRLRTAIVLAAAIAIAAFAVGYLVGDQDDASPARFSAERTIVLGKERPLTVVRFGEPDENGNTPMLVTVQGLRRQPAGNYYTLFMTRNGKPVVPCGTFNVGDDGLTSFRFSIAYDPERYDGLMLAEYRSSDHKDHPLLRAAI